MCTAHRKQMLSRVCERCPVFSRFLKEKNIETRTLVHATLGTGIPGVLSRLRARIPVTICSFSGDGDVRFRGGAHPFPLPTRE